MFIGRVTTKTSVVIIHTFLLLLALDTALNLNMLLFVTEDISFLQNSQYFLSHITIQGGNCIFSQFQSSKQQTYWSSKLNP